MSDFFELVNEMLRQYGKTRYFSVLGREASQINTKTLEKLDFIPMNHEASAGFAAASYSKQGCGVGCLVTTLGPGVTNATTSIASAFLDRVPMLVVCAQAESHDLYPNITHQCIDQEAMLRPISKISLTLPDLSWGSIEKLNQALSTLYSHPHGPVVINVPIDLFSTEITTDLKEWNGFTGDERPISLVGSSFVKNEFAAIFSELAKSNHIPIMTSYNAKGFINEANELSLGVASPYVDAVRGRQYYSDIFSKCDTIILMDTDYNEDIRPSIWQYGIDKSVILVTDGAPRYPSSICKDWIVVDVQDFIEGLKHSSKFYVGKQAPVGTKNWERISERFDTIESNTAGNVCDLYRALNTLQNSKFFVDVGLHRAIAGVLLEVGRHGQFTTSVGLSTFGFAIPSCFGAASSQGGEVEQSLVAICGDAGFASAIADLPTARRQKWPVNVIVVSDGKHSLIELYSSVGNRGDFEKYSPAFDCSPSDLASLCGWRTLKSTSPDEIMRFIGGANKLEMDLPSLIEFPVNYPIDKLSEDLSASFREFVHE